MDEAWVINQVRTGKTDVFGEIVEEYQAAIFRHVLRMTADREVAHDLTQDTFLKAYQSILKTDSELSLKAWLYRIATNNALKHHRRRRLLTFVPFRGTEKLPATQATPNTDEKIAIEDARTSTPGLGLLLWFQAVYGDEAPEKWAAFSDRILTVTPGWSDRCAAPSRASSRTSNSGAMRPCANCRRSSTTIRPPPSV